MGFHETTISSLQRLQSSTSLPIISALPRGPETSEIRPFVVDEPHSPASQAITRILAQIDTFPKRQTPRAVLVTASTREHCQSAVAFNLALCAARAGRRVALIDGDLNDRRLTRVLLDTVSFGVREVANGIVSIHHVLVDDPKLNMAFVPAAVNRQDSTARLDAAQFSTNVVGALHTYDLIIIDGGVLEPDTLSEDIARAAGDIVIVTGDQQSEVSAVHRITSTPSTFRSRIRGLIAVTDVKAKAVDPVPPETPVPEPVNPAPAVQLQPAVQSISEQPLAEQLRDTLYGLMVRWRVISLFLLATLGLAVLYIWTTAPLYSSRVEILIDPRQRQTVESEITPTGLGSSAAGADTLLLESQVEVLRSQQVIDALIRTEDLTADTEFSGGGSSFVTGALKSLVKAVIFGPQDQLKQSASPYDRTLTTLRKRMDVERQRNTYVISVTMRSKDPEKAARLANRTAQIYIEDVNSAASSSTHETATVLSSKLQELRQAANLAAAAVEDYRQEHNLINTNETLLVEQQLSDLNRELSQARTQVQSTLAERNQVRAAIAAGNSMALRLTEIGVSAVMSNLQTRLAEIEAQEADMLAVYLDSHPNLIRLRQRKAAVLSSLRQEYARILNRLDVAYKTAAEKASSLQADVAVLEQRMAASNTTSVQLKELQREADTSRQIYESFLRRSKEAWEQIDIPNSTARIISPAYAASKPSHPKVVMILAGALMLGLTLGLIVALLAHALARPSHARSPVPPAKAVPA